MQENGKYYWENSLSQWNIPAEQVNILDETIKIHINEKKIAICKSGKEESDCIQGLVKVFKLTTKQHKIVSQNRQEF